MACAGNEAKDRGNSKTSEGRPLQTDKGPSEGKEPSACILWVKAE